MKKYDSYKDSGIDWLGKIPKDWEITRISSKCDSLTGFPFKSKLYTDNPEHTKLVRGINVKEGVLNWKDTKYWEAVSDFLSKYYLEPGDLVIQMDGSKVGKNYAYITEDDLPLLLLQRVTRLRFDRKNFPRYFYYHFASSAFFHWVTIRKSDPLVPHITLKDIKCFYVPSPKLQEQKAIAQYLDAKTQAIDKKMALLEKKIGHYKALRKSIINETVTKGLDKNVELKDSGIDWIGQIPEHWEVKRFKDSFDIFTGNSISDKTGYENPTDAMPYVATKDINFDTGQIDFNNGIYILKSDKSFKKTKNNTSLICIEGANAGKKIGFTEMSVSFVNKLCAMKGKSYLSDDKYNFYYLNSIGFSEQFFSVINGLIGGVSINKIKEFIVLLPPKKEQSEIATYLDHKTQSIDKIVSNIQNQITALKELRKTLINEVVTGKIRVITTEQKRATG